MGFMYNSNLGCACQVFSRDNVGVCPTIEPVITSASGRCC